ncbi:AraC family transcriptional regulator [Bordetella sp. LUAb4]|uniref:helix-turn-helix transcriptional regulator n=1 Tax=Bordetella sp. LUAb4 TaxID=2843195 RepID=UPI001E55D1E7|nr:AraC family transcriptional regulator [Bordetella sp. LUAb4]
MPLPASLYGAPRLPHEWWRDTLPTVPVSDDWERTIALVERIDEGVSLVVLKGRPESTLWLPSPGTSVFGMQIWLSNGCQTGFDHGPQATPRTGDLALFEHAGPLGSLTCIPAGTDVHVVDVRFTPAALHMHGTLEWAAGLQSPDARDYSIPSQGGMLAMRAAPAPLLAVATGMLKPPVHTRQAQALWRRARVYDMLALVTDLLVRRDPTPVDLDVRTMEQLDLAQQTMRKDLSHPWAVANLARHVGLPEKRLQAAFRSGAGMSVYAYLRKLRLDAAADLLHGGASVTDAAISVGFSNLSHFSKSFRDHHGVPPGLWRQAAAAA